MQWCAEVPTIIGVGLVGSGGEMLCRVFGATLRRHVAFASLSTSLATLAARCAFKICFGSSALVCCRRASTF